MPYSGSAIGEANDGLHISEILVSSNNENYGGMTGIVMEHSVAIVINLSNCIIQHQVLLISVDGI